MGRRAASRCTALVVWALLATVGRSQSPQPVEPTEPDEAPRGWSYMLGNLGYMEGRVDPARVSGSNTGFALSLGAGGRFGRHLALELENLLTGSSYDARVQYPYSADEMVLTNWVLFVDVKTLVPFWKLEPYVGFGGGLSMARVEIASAWAPFSSSVREDHVGFATQWMAGLDYVYTRRARIGIEYRDVDSDASFGELSAGDIEIGGALLLLTIKVPI